MFRSFDDIQEFILNSGIQKKVALAAAHDEDALTSVLYAKKAGIISAVLIGDSDEIKRILEALGETPSDWEIIEESGEGACAAKAVKMVVDGQADIPMKGLLQTGTFFKAVFNKNLGLIKDKVLVSQATVAEFTDEKRLLIISDCAINIAPTYEDKIKLINNSVNLAKTLGFENPKVAVLAPVETVNPVMQCTIEAAMLSKAAERGQISGCIVDGPLALDNAISMEAARHKGIDSEVAGRADILIMPDLAAGNIFTKSLHFFAHMKTAGTVLGPEVPIIASSRTDTALDKYHAILMAVLQALYTNH